MLIFTRLRKRVGWLEEALDDSVHSRLQKTMDDRGKELTVRVKSQMQGPPSKSL